MPNPKSGSSYNPQQFLNRTYANCTHITHHLIINFLDDSHNVSFLESIEEVEGTVIIEKNNISHLPLPNLKVIRGKSRFKYTKTRPSASLYIVDNARPKNQVGVIDLRSLRSIIKGSVVVEYNTNLCFLKQVDWNSLSEEKNPKMYLTHENKCNAKASLTQCSKTCPVQNKMRHCWGPDPSQCQQLGPSCNHCPTKRCFLGFNDEPECCSNLCAGGCYNNKDSGCVSCKHVLDGKNCQKYCPPRKSPDFKRKLLSFCVKRCPDTYFDQDTVCQDVCDKDYYSDSSQTCVKSGSILNGRCNMQKLEESLPPDQRVERSSYTSRFLLQKIGTCSTLETKFIRINAAAVDPRSGSFSVREEDLQNLRNLTHITGCLHLDLTRFPGVKSLSFLSKLKSLSCTEPKSGLDVIHGSNLAFLGLTNLKELRVSRVLLSQNPKLCYLDKFRNHFQPPYEKEFFAESTPSAENCAKAGNVCDRSCNKTFGCWGPGHRRCVRCSVLRAGDACVSRCEEEEGFFTDAGAGKCRACHDECRGCTGPSERNCVDCRHVKNGTSCVSDCPLNSFNDSGICRTCATNCSVRTDTARRCSGPKAFPGAGGCNYCEFIEANKKLEVVRCLATAPSSHFYSRTIPPKVRRVLNNFSGTSSRLFIRCHPTCLKCTDSSHDTCDSCAKGYLYMGRRCYRECPPGSFQESSTRCQFCHSACRGGCNGTLANDCFVCSKPRMWLPNSTHQWECVEQCPEAQRYQHLDEASGEILCSDKPAGPMVTSISIFVIFCVFPLVIIIGGCLCCIYQRRRHLEKETLRAKYTGRREEDMVPLNASNVAPNFRLIRVVSANSLQKFGKLGAGAFGTVYRGRWIPKKEMGDGRRVKIDVAIKELRTSTSADSQQFLAEAKVMASVKNEFIVHLLGVCLSSPMQLITEFVPHGDLTSYIPRHRHTLTSRVLLTWALQIAKGMVYLESRGIVHRDLAARNVLVQNEDLVRITDFGLAKLLDSGNELRSTASERLPWAWLAIESLKIQAFSHKSDVWAYGVTLWEIFTYCESRPYADMRLCEVRDFLDSGMRLEQPQSCTLDLYMLLLKCWVEDLTGRPTFEEIVEEVTSMASDPNRYISTNARRLSVVTTLGEPTAHPVSMTLLPMDNLPADRPVIATSSVLDSQYEDPIRSPHVPVDGNSTAVEMTLAIFSPEESEQEPPDVRACGGDGYLAVTSSPT